MSTASVAHLASARVDVPSVFAFDKLSSAAFVGAWALGSTGLAEVAPGVYRGVSMVDGAEGFIEIRPFPELGLIDFAVGSLTVRIPRIFIRVTTGAALGLGDGACLVALHAMRSAQATPEAWARTCTLHEAEILLIKGQLEAAFAKGGGR